MPRCDGECEEDGVCKGECGGEGLYVGPEDDLQDDDNIDFGDDREDDELEIPPDTETCPGCGHYICWCICIEDG